MQDALLPGQRAEDRPDLIARVFAMKKAALVHKIWKEGILGRAVAYVYTVEFQKRGLPHVHFLVFLRRDQNPLTPGKIDLAVRAYFPDPDSEPLLHQIIKNHMVHGPCGDRCPRAMCMVNGKCEKRYASSLHCTNHNDGGQLPHLQAPTGWKDIPAQAVRS